MGGLLNVMEMRQLIEALEEQGLTPELAREVINSKLLARAIVEAARAAVQNKERFSGDSAT